MLEPPKIRSRHPHKMIMLLFRLLQCSIGGTSCKRQVSLPLGIPSTPSESWSQSLNVASQLTLTAKDPKQWSLQNPPEIARGNQENLHAKKHVGDPKRVINPIAREGVNPKECRSPRIRNFVSSRLPSWCDSAWDPIHLTMGTRFRVGHSCT